MAQAEGLWAHALSAGLRRRLIDEGAPAVATKVLAEADLTAIAWPADDAATVASGVGRPTAQGEVR